MMRILPLLFAFLLLPSRAFADAAMPCTTIITSPADGATAVPLNATVTGSATCTPQAPSFVDDQGAIIAANLAVSAVPGPDFTFTLKPTAPLAPNRAYKVTFANSVVCDRTNGQVIFSTAAKPHLRRIQFTAVAAELIAADFDLTEPIKTPMDLAPDSTLVTVTIDGFAPVGQGEFDGATSFKRSYKVLAQRPLLGQGLHVRLHKGLAFASGAVLADDLEVAVVPAEFPFGWSATGAPQACARASASTCQARRTGGLDAVTLGGLAMLLVLGLRRIRRPRPQMPPPRSLWTF